jgi:hypothetical protein
MALMNNGDAILDALLSLRDAVERLAIRLDLDIAAVNTRFDRFEVRVLERFDALDARLAAVEAR